MQTRTTHILLIRHGETDANATGTLQGHLPTPLNLRGVRQATLLAARMASYSPPVDVLISSDLPRATGTAGPVAAACGIEIRVKDAWRERAFGQLEGKPIGDRAIWQAASGEIDPPGAEPTADMHTRVRRALLRIVEKHSGKTVAVVTHGGPIRSVLKMLADGRLETIRNHVAVDVPTIPNGAILHLHARHYREGIRWRVWAVNDTGHLTD